MSVLSLREFEAPVLVNNEGHFKGSVRKEISMKCLDFDCEERDSHYLHMPSNHCFVGLCTPYAPSAVGT
jgi:hypothetical protein